MRLPAIALDRQGFVADVNDAADTVFDNDIKIKDRRLFVRDPDARTLLKEAIDQLKNPPRLFFTTLEPFIVPRRINYLSLFEFDPSTGSRTVRERTCVRF